MSSQLRFVVAPLLTGALVLLVGLASSTPILANEIFAQVRGVLLTEDGLPAAGYQVGLKNVSGDLFLSAPAGSDGHFELIQLPPDRYRMVAFDPQGVEFPLISHELTLQGGQVERIEIRIASKGTPPGRGGRAAPASSGNGLRGWWRAFPLAGKIGVVAVGAFAVYQVVDDSASSAPVSPSSP